MKHWWFVAATGLLVASALSVRTTYAQESSVGELRIVDESGTELGREESPPGEKHYRLPAGATGFRIAFDYDGTVPTPVQVRVMGPSGTVLLQTQEEYGTPGTQYVEFDNEGVPLEDQEYVVNVYLGTDPYLADSLQLAVGAAEIPGSVAEDVPTEGTAQATTSSELVIQTPGVTDPIADGQPVPGGPSWVVVAVAALGIVALALVVVWAGWSATKRT